MSLYNMSTIPKSSTCQLPAVDPVRSCTKSTPYTCFNCKSWMATACFSSHPTWRDFSLSQTQYFVFLTSLQLSKEWERIGTSTPQTVEPSDNVKLIGCVIVRLSLEIRLLHWCFWSSNPKIANVFKNNFITRRVRILGSVKDIIRVITWYQPWQTDALLTTCLGNENMPSLV